MSNSKELREAILALRKPKRELEPIKFCGCDCFIKPWTEKERMRFIMDTQESKTEDTDYLSRCRVIAHSLCDASGVLVFSMKDVEALGDLAPEDIAGAFVTIINFQKPDEVTEDEAKKN